LLAEQKNVVNKDWEGRNLELLTQIKEEDSIILRQVHRQKIESAKLLKKQIMDTFRRHLHIKFQQWKVNQAARIEKIDKLDRVLVKYERRERRKGFARYLNRTMLCREEAEGDERGRQLHAMLKIK
jgi:hypothetical protein